MPTPPDIIYILPAKSKFDTKSIRVWVYDVNSKQTCVYATIRSAAKDLHMRRSTIKRILDTKSLSPYKGHVFYTNNS